MEQSLTYDILKILISDVILASVFIFLANRHEDSNIKQEEKSLQEIKDHIDLRLEIIKEEILGKK